MLLLGALIVAQLAPLVIARRRGDVHYLALVLALQFLFFSVQQLTALASGLPLPHSDSALALLLLATVITTAIYFTARRVWRLGDTRVGSLSPLRVTPSALPVLALLAIADLLLRGHGSALLVTALALQFLATAALFLADCPAAPRLLFAARVLATVSYLVRYLTDATLVPALVLTLLWIVLAMIQASRAAIARVAGALLVLVSLQAGKDVFRVWQTAHPAATLRERAAAAGRGWDHHADLLAATRRLGDDSLTRVTSLSPHYVAFWHGHTYRALGWMAVPRALWPGKPSWNVWHEFGLRYHYLFHDDPSTSVAFHYLAEGYAGFGVAGLALAAALFGALLATVEAATRLGPPSLAALLYVGGLRPFFLPVDAFSLLSSLLLLGALLTALALGRRREVA